MAEVVAFRGIRYDRGVVGPVDRVVSPPYDVINEADQRRLYERSPFNAVRLDLAYDDPPGSRAEHARKDWARWLADGTLKRDPRPAYYAVEQTFKIPTGETRTRRGIIAAVRIDEPGGRSIIPHEKTLSGPKADRLKLMEAIPANLSPIFGVFRDAARRVDAAIVEALGASGDAVAYTGDDGIAVRFAPIDDPAQVRAIRETLADKELFIADGHHRYETARAYRDGVRARHPGASPRAPFNYCMMFVANTEDEGLVVLPYHRGIHGVAGFSPDAFLGGLGASFEIRDFPHGDRAGWFEAVQQAGQGRVAFGIALRGSKPRWVVATLKPDAAALGALDPLFRDLDVAVLNRLVFEDQLGITFAQIERGEHVAHYKHHDDLLDASEGKLQAAFLMNATRIEQVMAIGRAGQTMPPKSTMFYPKIPTGLVFAPLDPGDALE